MAYVTSIGATARVDNSPAHLAVAGLKKIGPVTGKTPPPTPVIRTLIGAKPKPAPTPGAVITPDGNVTLPSDDSKTIMIAGGAAAVLLLAVIALRR